MESIDIVKIQMVKDGTIPYGREYINGPRQLAELGNKFLGNADREMFVVVCLNSRNYVNCIHLVSVGTLTTAVISRREAMKVAILSNSAAMAFVHNHPSGDVEPSSTDIAITEWLTQCGELFEIRVLDHVIVSGDGAYMSFAERGIMAPAPHPCRSKTKK